MAIDKFIKRILLVSFVAVIFACEELPCEDSNGITLNLGFYKRTGSSLLDTTLQSFELQLLNDSSPPYSEEYARKQFISFPLDQNADSTRVVIIYEDELSDTLTFIYSRRLALESHACGFDLFYDLSDVLSTSNRLDSVWVRKPEVEYGDYENVKIYF